MNTRNIMHDTSIIPSNLVAMTRMYTVWEFMKILSRLYIESQALFDRLRHLRGIDILKNPATVPSRKIQTLQLLIV